MNIAILSLIFLFVCSTLSAEESLLSAQKHLVFSKISQGSVEPRPVMCNWSMKVQESWDSGGPKEILFISDENWPVKKMFYYPSGQLFQEMDLADVSQGNEYKEVIHGAVWTYYENGEIMRTDTWLFGKKEGVEKTFSEEGDLIQERNFLAGVLEGESLRYFPSGEISERIEYTHGQRSGKYEIFAKDGSQRYTATYVRGLLQGRSMEWWENGNVKSICFWMNGLLNNFRATPALSKYSADGRLVEQKEYIGGSAHGKHIRWHENGVEKTSIRWVMGQKEGPQEYYDDCGQHIGHREFVHGVAVGKQWRKDSSSHMLMMSDPMQGGGNLVQEVVPSGALRWVYETKEGKIQGECIGYDSSGQVVKKLLFDSGMLHGKQIGFFPSGGCHYSFEYVHGKREGLQEQWFENHQKSVRGMYKDGRADGLFEMWYMNGTKCLQASYKKGVVDGVYFTWHENGEKATVKTWADGLRTSKGYVWNPQGVMLSHEEWKNGVPDGHWESWDDSGKKQSECFYLNGELHGKDVAWFDDGTCAHVFFWKNGKRDGLQEEWFEDGSLCFKGSFSLGKPEDVHQRWYEKTSMTDHCLMSEERYVRGLLEGKQVFYYPNKKVKMEAEYSKGLLNGSKKAFNEVGECIFSAEYCNGCVEGSVFRKKSDGCEEIQWFKNNHPDGTWQIYYPQHPTFGRIKALQANFSRGLLDGEYIEYDQTGQPLFSVLYEHGRKEGTACTFSPDGRIWMTVDCQNDELHGFERIFYSNGSLQRERIYVHNRLEGEDKKFHEDGSLAQIAHYKDGKLDGIVQSWDLKGRLTFEGMYVKGLRSGSFKKYDFKKRVYIIQKFDNDVLVDRHEDKSS